MTDWFFFFVSWVAWAAGTRILAGVWLFRERWDCPCRERPCPLCNESGGLSRFDVKLAERRGLLVPGAYQEALKVLGWRRWLP